MTDTEIQAWLSDWFAERNPDRDSPLAPTENYYDAGLVDSFGIIELIEEIEKKYDIMFDDDEFTQPAFMTIEGLAKLVQQKRAAGS